MNIVLNFKELIRQYVAPYRRGSNRLKWLWGLVDLQGVYDTFPLGVIITGIRCM